MARSTDDVNGNGRRYSWERVMEWVDVHPRTGWFLSSLMLINTFINLITLYIVS